ncbi:DNA polymerase III subunit gamma/tau [Periweissella cryptocerci]|uniref:DNA-directed DNA polymerase n=1 Tax=Periweissella cryptocerci TaxID=2506420 RepID=A0A4P6YT37_9LACO|nr:DNA polymerase III subunit gamma/tau [Periweissella cryptocerci]QBO35807.1 DNA polymerase III subunit gamma/tau [Periweissella cryptocerci]
MAYQALYRVWRPQTFKDMVGQDVVTKTLKNAILTGQTSHAYLFTGPRGTGKTSAAKIFAKALNCLDLQDGEPCNKCANCVGVNDGSLNDVIEIDAASNNGVEEIRDIRDKAKYAPTQAPNKVYIIDEVHMLSTGAFNALLKTLEEPPAQVVFILATTEPHKIPATIISRTQRFDFKRITLKQSLERMEYILDQKGYQYDETALKVIGQAAEGGMRDALSILDQTLSFGDEAVTLDNALLVTGSVTQNLLSEYVENFTQHETQTALATLQSLLDEGKDANRFIEDLIGYVRDLLLANDAPQMVNAVTDDRFQALAKAVSPRYLYAVIDELNQIQQQLRFTTHPDVYLEVLTVKLSQLGTQPVATAGTAPVAQQAAPVQTQAQPVVNAVAPAVSQPAVSQPVVSNTPVVTPAATPAPAEAPVSSRMAQVQAMMAQSTPDSKPASQARPTAPVVNTATATPASNDAIAKVDGQAVFDVLKHATKPALSQMQNIYGDLLNMLSVVETAKMTTAQPVAASPEAVILAFAQPYIHHLASMDAQLQQDVFKGINRLIGEELTLVFISEDQWKQARQSFAQQHKQGIPVDQMVAPALTKLEFASQPAVQPTVPEVEESQDNVENALPAEPVVDAAPSNVVQKAEELFGADFITVENN